MKKTIILTLGLCLGALAFQPAKTPPDPAKQFAKADRDGDGKLTLQEFQGKNTKNAEKRAKRFARLDANGDGSLTLEEFKAGRRRAQQKSQQTQ